MRSLKPVAITAGLLLVLSITAACGDSAGGRHSQPPADDQWTLSGQPEPVVAAYLFVAAHRQHAAQVPCYCGCWGLGHTSLLDCYVKPRGGYEEHASGCGVCRDEAVDLQRFIDGGQDVAAARAYIDAQYSKLGKPTDTP